MKNKLLLFLSVSLIMLLLHLVVNDRQYHGYNNNLLLIVDGLLASTMVLWTAFALSTKANSKLNFVNRFLLLTSMQFLAVLALLTYLAYTVRTERISLVLGVLLYFVLLMITQSAILIRSQGQNPDKKE